jgi:hypothetical protein
MSDKPFRAGEQLWLRGTRVTFVDHHGYADNYRVAAAVIRRHDETEARVVPMRKLARDRLESLSRETTLLAG